MKAARIVQVVLVVLTALYIWLFHSANPVPVELPFTRFFLPTLPVSYVVVLALLIGWLVGYLPSSLQLWRRNRELRRAQKQVVELQKRLEPISVRNTGTYYADPEVPVIPDRASDFTLDDYEGGRNA